MAPRVCAQSGGRLRMVSLCREIGYSAAAPAGGCLCSNHITSCGAPYPPLPERSSPGVHGTCRAPSLEGAAGPGRQAPPGQSLTSSSAFLLVQPGLEEMVEVLAADSLGQRGEVAGRHVAATMFAVPGPENREERVVADLLAQRLERHRAAVVYRRRRTAPTGRAGRPAAGTRDPAVGGVLRRPYRSSKTNGGLVAAVTLGTDPLRPGREALVQPDVRPSASETESPNHWWASSCTTVAGSSAPPSSSASSATRGSKSVRRPVHDSAHGIEWIGPVEVAEERDHHQLDRQAVPGERGLGVLLL